MEYVKSIRGCDKLKYEGYLYVKDKSCDDKVYWRCDQFKSKLCNARAIVRNRNIVLSSSHNHAATANEVTKVESINNMKRKARESTISHSQNMAVEFSNLPDQILAIMPSKKSLKKSLRRARGEDRAGFLNNHVDLYNYIVPEELQITESGKRFLLYDSGHEEGRIMFFSTKYNLKVLSRLDNWFGDGTFDLCSSEFYQIYTIHGFYESRIVSLVYALLPDKKKETYNCFLQALKRMSSQFGYQLKPKQIMIDFEIGMANAFQENFEGVEVSYCFFHFTQSLYRNISKHGLKSLYDNDESFCFKMKKIAALAFIPEDEVIKRFEELVVHDFAEMDEHLQDYLHYFEKTYIGAIVAGRRREPLFAIKRWNQYESTLNDLPRTNNNVEGWHRGFEQLFDRRKNNVALVIKAFKNDQELTRKVIVDIQTGQDRESPRKKYASYSKRIKKIVTRYYSKLYEDNQVQYLSDIASLLSY